MKVELTPQLCAAGRVLASIDIEQLAEFAGLSTSAVSGFESGMTELVEEDRDRLAAAFHHFGVEFLAEGDAGAGLRLKFNRQETGQIQSWEEEGGQPADDDVP